MVIFGVTYCGQREVQARELFPATAGEGTKRKEFAKTSIKGTEAERHLCFCDLALCVQEREGHRTAFKDA